MAEEIQIPNVIKEGIKEGIEFIKNAYIGLNEASTEASQNIVKPFKTINDFKKDGGFEGVIEADIKLNSLSKALGLIPVVGTAASQNMKDLAEGLRNLSNISATEGKVLDGLSDLMTLKAGTAFKKFAEILKEAAAQRQTFQIELTKLGQDSDLLIKRIDAQANAVAMLGISYKNLQEAAKDTINFYNASIFSSDQQRASFEKNRESIQQLIAFNKRYGIETKDSANLVNLFNDTLGGGVKSAQIFSDELQKFADKTGQPVNAVFKGFTENMDRFSVMSMPRALESFSKLEAFAKRSGKELKTIMSDMEKYDDLSTGYEKLGKMNRVLMQFGSSINPMAFMKASDEERQKMLIDAVAKTQGSFSALQTEQAKRQVAKSLAEATDLPFQTALGLASGQTKLKDALDDALKVKTPTEKEMTGYSEKERMEKGKAVTSFKEAQELRDALLQTKSSVDFLAKGIREADFKKISQIGALYEKLDKSVFKATAERDQAYFTEFNKVAAEALGKAITESMSNPTQAMQNFTDAVTRTLGVNGAPPPSPPNSQARASVGQ